MMKTKGDVYYFSVWCVSDYSSRAVEHELLFIHTVMKVLWGARRPLRWAGRKALQGVESNAMIDRHGEGYRRLSVCRKGGDV